MTHAVSVLAAIAVLWSAATLVPGPDFLVTTRVALTNSRRVGLRTVFGVACGTCVWGLAGFFGIHVLFLAAPWLYVALKLCGGAYLVWLGIRLLLESFTHGTADQSGARPRLSEARAFRLGLVTNIANPKAALFTASLFAATLPADPPVTLGFAAAALMTLIALSWYGVVTCVLTAPRAARAFGRLRRWIDRAAGLAFIGFGTMLAVER
jgi:RhtB (resistance to homoserine/threonine) family protein